MKLQKLEKNHAIYLGIGLAVFALLVVVLIFIGNNCPGQEEHLHNSELSETELEDQFLSIDNYAKLGDALDYKNANIVRKQLEGIVFDETELTFATKEAESSDGLANHYKSTLVEDSFALISEDPVIYSFVLEVSDGRTYQVYTRYELEYYDGINDYAFSTIAIRDGVVNFATSAKSDYLLGIIGSWRSQF